VVEAERFVIRDGWIIFYEGKDERGDKPVAAFAASREPIVEAEGISYPEEYSDDLERQPLPPPREGLWRVEMEWNTRYVDADGFDLGENYFVFRDREGNPIAAYPAATVENVVRK